MKAKQSLLLENPPQQLRLDCSCGFRRVEQLHRLVLRDLDTRQVDVNWIRKDLGFGSGPLRSDYGTVSFRCPHERCSQHFVYKWASMEPQLERAVAAGVRVLVLGVDL